MNLYSIYGVGIRLGSSLGDHHGTPCVPRHHSNRNFQRTRFMSSGRKCLDWEERRCHRSSGSTYFLSASASEL